MWFLMLLCMCPTQNNKGPARILAFPQRNQSQWVARMLFSLVVMFEKLS